MRTYLLTFVGMLVVALFALGWQSVHAQQQTQSSTWVLSKSGFTVEEVKVGGSCVVIVSRMDRSTALLDTAPCS